MISLTTIMIAKEIDLDKSKGIDQERIVSLYPEPAKKDIAQDITIKILFDVALDAKHLKKNDITLEKISDKKKKVKGETILSTDAKTVTFKPEVPLEVGYYEIKIKSLKPIKEEKKKKIKEIKYRFYVTEVEVINGYTLPPEPDETINNSTLLGIDSNDNGVRDDVERWVIKTLKNGEFKNNLYMTDIFLHEAKNYQLRLANEDPAPEEVLKLYIDSKDYDDCLVELDSELDKYNEVTTRFMDIVFNTHKRLEVYFLYEKRLPMAEYYGHHYHGKNGGTFSELQAIEDACVEEYVNFKGEK